ncbi:MAG: class GN sortase [Parvibaculum sp.]|uniref:class GN sortase n=1 Tax=Parvibaculum sp. TaxID=2024848 RepID=UPI000C5C91DE|nr:class GN sortase [Parvibaculum sp.]MAU59829.1 class GN sortase [Parvibaculum sp.]HAC57809.1 class GN sortase [Rhodobiaceae bacterium]
MRPVLTQKVAALLWAAAILGCIGFGGWQLGQGLYIKAKAEVAQILLERAWEKTLADGKPHKAWPWADTWPVAKLEIPSQMKSEIVLAGGTGEALAFGPGHLFGSPDPGKPGTSVIAGHRDTHFAFLRHLKNDDTVIVTTRDRKQHLFRVRGSRIVEHDNSQIDPHAGFGIALVTCFPFDAREQGPLRYVVFAEAVADAS